MLREEDGAVALVRVYCGLGAAESATRPASAGSVLVAAVVDDAGRLLEVCEIGDDPAGYARLGALLAERPGGLSGAAVVTDSDDHLVVSLLSEAGRPIAVADDDSVDDFAERFADDDSLEEMNASPAERRAIGMARALQAGALSATALPAPRDLAGYKPVLAAHAALADGRNAAAVALREVLRGLYPAALRAYPDPADPVSLAVLDALPEPGMLTAGGSRDVEEIVEAVANDLIAAEIGDPETVTEAVTALRLAISEAHRRTPVNTAITAASAETVRQAIAAVRAYDAGSDALVAVLAARVTQTRPAPPRRAVRRSTTAPVSAPPSSVGLPAHPAEPDPAVVTGRRGRVQPTPTHGAPPPAPRPAATPTASPPAARRAAPPALPAARTDDAYLADPPGNRPVSVPPPPPPGITPIAPAAAERPLPPAEAGEPFRATLTTAAINSARAERQRANQTTPARSKSRSDSPSDGFGPTDYSVPVPTARPKSESPPPGSRANWPLVNSSDDRASGADRHDSTYSLGESAGEAATDGGRVTPPWLADDLPPEPPMLRLVEPSLADGEPRGQRPEHERESGTPSLRLVDPDVADRSGLPGRGRGTTEPASFSPPPISDDDDDDDLLIFAAARSAWFTDQPEDSDVGWTSQADSGWQAAEQAARPAVGESTRAGLPRRVPKANLVPGSPLREEGPLRIVRDAARIAENTTGYFRGFRRGQEIGGYAVSGRPGRESTEGWDFSRDHDEHSEYEYRSARY
ncbi:MAG TPA: transposase [Micromonosporaceae bacterium]|nr:transposase [Micromonosporaceae bacterium]